MKTWTCFCPSNLLDLKGQRDPGEESFRKRGEIVVKQKLIWVGYLKIEYPRWLSGKESAFRRHRSLWLDPWVGKIPWRRAWQPTPVFLPTESHGQVAGYSPQGQIVLRTEATEYARTHSSKLFRTVRELSNTFNICSVFCVCFTSIQKYWEINKFYEDLPNTVYVART